MLCVLRFIYANLSVFNFLLLTITHGLNKKISGSSLEPLI